MSKEQLKKIDKQLLNTTVFVIDVKKELKEKISKIINEIIDEKFKFLEKDLREANWEMYKLKNEEEK